MTSKPEDIDALLKFDPLAEAEKVTGRSYKDDEGTMWLGMGLLAASGDAKAAALSHAGDTHMRISYQDAVSVFTGLGFEPVLTEEFNGGYEGHERETYQILWHPDGILATLESYGEGLNSGQVLYNWLAPDEEAYGRNVSSGRGIQDPRGWILVGHHDAREGVKRTIQRMRSKGRFLSTWRERPFLWLLNYVEGRDQSGAYRELTEARIAALPTYVREAITP